MSNWSCFLNPEQKACDLANLQIIIDNSKPFYHNRDVDDTLLGEYINEIEEFDNGEEENAEEDGWVILEDEEYARNYLTGSSASSSSASTRFLPPKFIDHEVYKQMMRTLNYKQRKIVMYILHCLKTGKLPINLFITGGAGVGKSRVIDASVQSFLRFNNSRVFNNDVDNVCVIVSAPTGCAAFNVNGMTCHNAFNLPASQNRNAFADLPESKANELRFRYRNVQLFIIDEISMIGSRMLEWIDNRLRQLFDQNSFFGGKSVILVGHLRQLPPIPGGESNLIFKTPIGTRMASVFSCSSQVQGGDPAFSSESQDAMGYTRSDRWSIFKFFELDEIMRQRDEYLFIKALNNMSEGTMDDDDVALIRSREISDFLKPPDEAFRLFRLNDDCQKYNNEIYNKLNTEWIMSTAIDDVEGIFQTIMNYNIHPLAIPGFYFYFLKNRAGHTGTKRKTKERCNPLQAGRL